MVWYLNPKNIILCVLALLVVAISGLYLWQRAVLKDKDIVITRQDGKIATMLRDNVDLQGQIRDYKTNLAQARKAQKAQQSIQTTTATIREEVLQIKTVVILEEADEKIISDATYYFNSGGLRRSAIGDTTADSKAGGKVLPGAGPPDPDRSHHWTVKQIMSNYLELIDYALKLEKTVDCYEYH
jgi:hypothetical protein